MWKKPTMLFGISALLLVGCNNGNDDLPADNETPMEDMNEEEDLVPDGGETNGTNGNGTNGNGTNGNGATEDQNLDEDQDIIEDQNTEEEEMIEDDVDVNDADGKDE